MAKQQFGLGKGLGALLGGVTVESGAVTDSAPAAGSLRKPVAYVNKEAVTDRESTPADTSDILRINVDLIETNPYQPRMGFSAEALGELTESIRSLGLIQPVTVRRKGEGKYQLISGERRFRACKAAGMDMIPAYIIDADDQGMLEMAIVENIQRENLDPIEVAMSYRRLMDECHLTQEQMAGRIGKKRASIANSLRLLRLPATVQHDLKVGLLSVGHAKVILGVEDPALQEELCDCVIREGLSVRQLEERLKRLTQTGAKTVTPRETVLPESLRRVEAILDRYFPGEVSLRRDLRGRGSLTLRFRSDAQLEKFLNALEDKGL